MLSPLHNLLRHHPGYSFGRSTDLPPYTDRPRSAFDEFEELERCRPVRDESEEQWRRQSHRAPETFIGDLAAALLVLFAIWGSIMVFYDGSPERQAGQQAEPKAAATELTSR